MGQSTFKNIFVSWWRANNFRLEVDILEIHDSQLESVSYAKYI